MFSVTCSNVDKWFMLILLFLPQSDDDLPKRMNYSVILYNVFKNTKPGFKMEQEKCNFLFTIINYDGCLQNCVCLFYELLLMI